MEENNGKIAAVEVEIAELKEDLRRVPDGERVAVHERISTACYLIAGFGVHG